MRSRVAGQASGGWLAQAARDGARHGRRFGASDKPESEGDNRVQQALACPGVWVTAVTLEQVRIVADVRLKRRRLVDPGAAQPAGALLDLAGACPGSLESHRAHPAAPAGLSRARRGRRGGALRPAQGPAHPRPRGPGRLGCHNDGPDRRSQAHPRQLAQCRGDRRPGGRRRVRPSLRRVRP